MVRATSHQHTRMHRELPRLTLLPFPSGASTLGFPQPPVGFELCGTGVAEERQAAGRNGSPRSPLHPPCGCRSAHSPTAWHCCTLPLYAGGSWARLGCLWQSSAMKTLPRCWDAGQHTNSSGQESQRDRNVSRALSVLVKCTSDAILPGTFLQYPAKHCLLFYGCGGFFLFFVFF